MSLLLEALKKAELAKQAAAEPPASDTPPFTRDKLPDIRQPMEIRSEDLSVVESEPPKKRTEKPALELALEEPAHAAAAPEPQSASRPAPVTRAAPVETDYSPPSEALERKQAQQVFEAKEMDVNPRKPFYYTVGALCLFGVGTAGYFWYEMQPKNNYKIPPPSAQPAPAAAAPAAPATAPDTPAAATVTPPVGSQPALPATGVPGTAAAGAVAPATAPAAARVAAPTAPRGPVFARPAAPASGAAPAPQPGQPRRARDVTITPARAQTDPVLDGAYQAYNAGDVEKARGGYQEVLRANPASRDALLGLAAVEIQAKRYAAAENHYMRLLELDPRDTLALAGLIGLRGQIDPMAAESRLKNMIAAQPESGILHFTLGNQYAAQGRWTEAQQAYFQAYSSDSDNADFAYNLAISLDRLHQTKPALEYYRRALALGASRPIAFDKAQVSKRVAQLEREP